MNTVKVKNVIFNQGKPKICVPIVSETKEALFKDLDFVTSLECDVIEWRIDHFEDVTNINELISVAKKVHEKVEDKVLLTTFRSFKEGGVKDISDELYQEIYTELLKHKHTDMIDVELFMPDEIRDNLVKLSKEQDIKVILCNHDFDKTVSKEEIIHRLTLMQEKGADLCKIALMPNNKQDVLTLLEATLEMYENHAKRPIITMSMGGLGAISRVCGELFGSAMTFGVGTVASAPGQISVNSLNETLEILNKAL